MTRPPATRGAATQPPLFERPAVVPDLASYDLILVNTSAGKDSQATMDVVAEHAAATGVSDRVVAVHADLGPRIEWPGTTELAAEHAAHYGFPFEVVRNRVWGDLLDRIEARGKWPDKKNRYCTSEFKTAQVRILMTALVRLRRAAWGLSPNGTAGRVVRILDVLGMRAEESDDRARRLPFRHDAAASNTKRHVDEWLPIHTWTVDEVWARNEAAGTRHHWAYDRGMSRLSCRFCILASRADLVVSARENPEVAAEYAAAEARMGHRFQARVSMADIIEAADRVPQPTAGAVA